MRKALLILLFIGSFFQITALWLLAVPSILDPKTYARLIGDSAWQALLFSGGGTAGLIAAWFSFFRALSGAPPPGKKTPVLSVMLCVGLTVSISFGVFSALNNQIGEAIFFFTPLIGLPVPFLLSRGQHES